MKLNQKNSDCLIHSIYFETKASAFSVFSVLSHGLNSRTFKVSFLSVLDKSQVLQSLEQKNCFQVKREAVVSSNKDVNFFTVVKEFDYRRTEL